MTRKAFWPSLLSGLGIARAQVVNGAQPLNPQLSGNGTTTTRSNHSWSTGLAVNNECPECGMMADPYVMERGQVMNNCHGVGSDDGNALGLVSCDVTKIVIGKRNQIVRCRRCNAAFFQDGV